MSFTTDASVFWVELAQRRGQGKRRSRATSAELVELLTLDPGRQYDRGRLKARRASLEGDDRTLVDKILALCEPTTDAAAPLTHPMALDRAPKRRGGLNAGDLKLLDDLRAAAPSAISDTDARIVAELEAVAETSAERRLVAQVAEPLRRHHDRRLEEAQLRTTVADAARPVGWRTLESAALPLLADRMTEEALAQVANDLKDAGVSRETVERMMDDAATLAERNARDVLTGAWRAAEDERNSRKAAAEFRLSELALGKPPKSSAVDHAAARSHEAAEEAGRERARRHQTPALDLGGDAA